MSATLDDIYGVLKECCAKLGTSPPGAPGTGAGGAPGTGAGGAPGTGGLGQELGNVGAMTGSVNQLEDAVKQAQAAVGNARKGTQEYDDALQELRKAQTELNKEVEKGTKGLGGFGKALGKAGKAAGAFGSLIKGAGGLALDYVKATMDLTSSLRAAEQSFRATTGASKAMADNIGQAYDQLRIYGVSIEKARAATDSLYGSVSDFSTMSGKQQQDLVKTGALLAENGVDTGTYASGIQHAMKTMSMSGEEASQMFIEMRATAIDLQMPIEDLTGAFSSIGDELALLGKDGPKVLKELARISKITGVEMGKIVSIAEKFDTFEGAAEAAGSLNAMLGGNFVNSMDLMMAQDPAERFMMLRDALDASGQSFENMGRFQKIAMAQAMDVDVPTLAKMMSGNMADFDKEMGKTKATMDDVELDAFSMKSFEDIGDNMLKATMPSINAIENALTATFDANARTMLDVTKQLNETMIKGTEDVMRDMPPWLMELLMSLGLLLQMFPGIGTAVSGMLGGISAGAAVTAGAVAATGYMLYKGVVRGMSATEQAMEQGASTTEVYAASVIGTFGGIGEGLDYLLGGWGKDLGLWEEGLVSTISRSTNSMGMSLTESLDAFDYAAIGETFDYMWTSVIDGAYDTFLQPWVDLWDAISLNAEESFDGMLEFFGISSNSKKFEFMGNSMVGGLMDPFGGLSKKMSTEVENAGAITLEKAGETAGKLNAVMGGHFVNAMDLMDAGTTHADAKAMVDQALADSGKTSLGYMQAKYIGEATGSDKPYVLNLSMNMDGREMDKKVVNVVGGIAQAATYGD